jgi:hypothetical protein
MPKQQQKVVGFYKDHGKTKPITKSTAQLNRTKVVRHPQQFHGVNPQGSEKLNRERQRAQVDSNLGKMNNLLRTLNQNLEQRGHEMEDLKNQYDQALQQQDPKKASVVQAQMNRLLFIVQSLAKKRDAVQAKVREFEVVRAKL